MENSEINFITTKGYELIKELGAGSFGRTVLLRDNSIDELFVCKKYEPQPGLKKEDFYESFRKEIKLMYKINHPNIVRIYNYYLYDSVCSGYILMEYIDGCNIEKWFDDFIFQNVDSNHIFRQLILAFDCIEKAGIIHRDIRSSNILITNENTVKVIDFGLGKNIKEGKVSLDSFNKLINRQQMQYFPNEFADGKYTSKTDMFCLAELFNRIIKKYDINDFQHGYILRKMMEADPFKRYESFEAILVALDKKDFKALDISEDDKKIYTDFVGQLVNCIASFQKGIQFINIISDMISGIQSVLEKNCLDYYIQANNNLIDVFVGGAYRYYNSNRRKISVEVVQNFYDWFCSKDEQFQQVIMKNLVNKLSTIEVVDDVELPF